MTSLRNWVYGRLSTATPITDLVGDRIFPPNAIGESNAAAIARPLLMVNMGLSTVDVGMTVQPFAVWAHDDQGGMETVDLLMKLIRTQFDGLAAIKLTGGAYIYECVWEGDSGDLFDDAMRTGTKFGSYRVVART